MKAALELIGWIIQLVFAILDKKMERDKEVKSKKEEALRELRKGIKERDASKVNLAFDRLRRI